MSVGTQRGPSISQPGPIPIPLNTVYRGVQFTPFMTRPPHKNRTVATDDIAKEGQHVFLLGAGQASSGAPLNQQYGPASTQPFSGGVPLPNASVPTGDVTQTGPHVSIIGGASNTGGGPYAGPTQASSGMPLDQEYGPASTQPFSGGAPPPHASVATGDVTQTAPHVSSTGGIPYTGPTPASAQQLSGGDASAGPAQAQPGQEQFE